MSETTKIDGNPSEKEKEERVQEGWDEGVG